MAWQANLPAVDIGGKTFAIALGDRHSCGLVEGGFVKCWGWNNYGQLGYGDTRQRGDGVCQMGARNLPAVNLGGVATDIKAGTVHTCALMVRREKRGGGGGRGARAERRRDCRQLWSSNSWSFPESLKFDVGGDREGELLLDARQA